MRLTHIITTIEYGGAEKQLLVLAREQVNLGYHVSIIYLKGLPKLESEFITAGCKVIHTLVGRNLFFKILWLRKYSKSSADIFHAHLPESELLTAFSFFSTPWVVSRHVAFRFIPRFPEFISRLLSLFVAFRADGVIAISKAVKHHLISAKEILRSKEIRVIYYGSNESLVSSKEGKFNIREFYKIPKNSFVIGTIARIVEQKDFPTLLKSFEIFQSQFSDAYLLILGDGHLAKQMQEYAIELGIHENVVWAGKHPDVLPYLREMDIFVLTSVYEGFGLVLLEAMQVGIPVVASRNTSVPEVLGQTYPYLVQTGDYESFARSYGELVSSQSQKKVLKILAERVVSCNPRQLAVEIHSFYREVI